MTPNNVILMKIQRLTLIATLCVCAGFVPTHALADMPVENGIYYISCTKLDGYLGLGARHNVDPYIYYVTGEEEKTPDAYWTITNTPSGYTFRNEATKQLLVYTTDRVDQYYKYMTLADKPLGNGSEYWNIIAGSDGAFSIQSTAATSYYWNLRSGTNMLGTYMGSSGNAANERFTFHKKINEDEGGDDGGDDDDPPVVPTFPQALHVYLSDGRVEAYPLEYVTNHYERDGKLVIETNIARTFTYNLPDVDSVSEKTPENFPAFESFKFNNDFNDQLFTTANGEMVGDTVFVTVAAIGKRLTPSFKVTDDNVAVYVDGKLQISKESRLRFDKDIYYLVARRDHSILTPEADNKYFMRPYGRFVRVHTNWLTDKAEVPTIYIKTSDGQAITSKDYFKQASITIDGHGIFPSMEETPIQIKGRGNSSWGWPKKPYRIKFAEKVKPLGMTKGKNWVLLSNYQTGSLMSNAIGMKAANLMKASAANHIVPVDLYLNGEYRGSYNLTEKVGFSNNSVDLADETAAALLELDSYYDAASGQKFRSVPYSLPINIKEPEFAEGTTSLTLATIKNDFNNFMRTLDHGKDISRHVDIQQLARFLMVNELICNFELYHPKSTFCYRESFASDTSKYVFGPVWDLDWGFGYQQHGNYFKANVTTNYWTEMPNFDAKLFLQDLRWNYEPMCLLYKQLWKKFLDEDLQELLEYCQDYYDFAKKSFTRNRTKWGDATDYAKQATEAATWLQKRAERIYEDILNDKRPTRPQPSKPIVFDNNKIYTITCARGDLILSYDLKGLEAGQSAFWPLSNSEKQFAIINIEGNNYLYSPSLKKYLRTGTASNGEWVSQLGSPIYFDTSNADGDYQYMMSTLTNDGSILWFNNNGHTIVINDYSTPDPGDRWKITEAGSFDPSEALRIAQSNLIAVNMNLMFDGEVIASQTKKMPYGAEMPTPPSDWSNAFVRLLPVGTHPYVVTEETTIAYEAKWTGPFVFTTSMEDATWYNMTIRSNYMVGKTDTEPYCPVAVYDADTLALANFQWAFSGNPYKVKVYNRSTGMDEVLTLVDQDALMRTSNFEWEILPNSDGFVLRVPGTQYLCLNQFGGQNGPLRIWNSANSLTDDGSTFRLTVAPDPDGIVPIFAEKGDGTIYDLAGRRVNHRSLRPGIYIVNGRKVFIK